MDGKDKGKEISTDTEAHSGDLNEQRHGGQRAAAISSTSLARSRSPPGQELSDMSQHSKAQSTLKTTVQGSSKQTSQSGSNRQSKTKSGGNVRASKGSGFSSSSRRDPYDMSHLSEDPTSRHHSHNDDMDDPEAVFKPDQYQLASHLSPFWKSTKGFLIIILIILVLVGTIVGGVLGGRAASARRKDDDDDDTVVNAKPRTLTIASTVTSRRTRTRTEGPIPTIYTTEVVTETLTVIVTTTVGESVTTPTPSDVSALE